MLLNRGIDPNAEIALSKLAARTRVGWCDHFVGRAGATLDARYWTVSTPGGGAGTCLISAATKHGGAAEGITGAAAGNDIMLEGPDVALDFARLPAFELSFDARTAAGIYGFGIRKDADEYAILRYDPSVGDTAWMFVTCTAAGAVATATGIPFTTARSLELKMFVGLRGAIYTTRAEVHCPAAGIVHKKVGGAGNIISGAGTHCVYAYAKSPAAGGAKVFYLDFARFDCEIEK